MTQQVYHGLNVSWGLGATAITITGATGLFQSNEHDLKLDENEIRDQRGSVVVWTGYNPTATCMFEYYVSDLNAAASGSAPLVLGTNVPDRGSMVSITSSHPVSGSNWIITDTLIRETNTEAVKVTLKGVQYPLITS